MSAWINFFKVHSLLAHDHTSLLYKSEIIFKFIEFQILAFPTKPNANKNGCEKRLNKSAGCAGCICMFCPSLSPGKRKVNDAG